VAAANDAEFGGMAASLSPGYALAADVHAG